MAEFDDMSLEEFNRFKDLIYDEAGIHLTEKKKTLLTNRIRKRLLALKIHSFADYFRHIQTAPDRHQEIVQMIDAVTTNVTEFYRNPKQFDTMREKVLPVIAERNKLKKTVHVLSAGCSSGEEPYTIAMVLKDFFSKPGDVWTFQIDAVDISTAILKKAEEGIYPVDKMSGVDEECLKRHFKSAGPGQWQIREELRRMISFRKFNLNADAFPVKYDVIFCRNVVIYFDRPTKDALYEKFHGALVPGGFLLVGYSEGILNDERFKYFSPGIYTRQERKGV
jgi:chemotaxis protein methyltransferase CheR